MHVDKKKTENYFKWWVPEKKTQWKQIYLHLLIKITTKITDRNFFLV